MTYIKRRGITWSTFNFVLTIIVVILSMIYIDFSRHSRDIIQFRAGELGEADNYDGSEDLVPGFTNDTIIVLVFYFSLALVVMSIWYNLGKIIGPRVGVFIARWFLSGLGSQPFLDSGVNKRKLPWTKYLMRFINLTILLFSLDLLFQILVYDPNLENFVPNADEASFVVMESFFIALGIIVLLESSNWLLEDVGLRSYNEGYNEIRAVSSLLEKYMFRLLRTGALLGVLGAVVNSTSIGDLAIPVRTIFGRAVLMSIFINFNFSVFYQPEAIKKDWHKKNVPIGTSTVKFLK